MAWWIWILLGFLLLGLELAVFGLHLAFFGLGAFIVGLLVALGVGGPLWFQLLLFTVTSLTMLALIRGPLLKRIRKTSTKDVDPIVGESATALETIEVESVGRAEMRGTSWSARNVGPAPVQAGQRCRVEKIEGLLLLIKAQS